MPNVLFKLSMSFPYGSMSDGVLMFTFRLADQKWNIFFMDQIKVFFQLHTQSIKSRDVVTIYRLETTNPITLQKMT